MPRHGLTTQVSLLGSDGLSYQVSQAVRVGVRLFGTDMTNEIDAGPISGRMAAVEETSLAPPGPVSMRANRKTGRIQLLVCVILSCGSSLAILRGDTPAQVMGGWAAFLLFGAVGVGWWTSQIRASRLIMTLDDAGIHLDEFGLHRIYPWAAITGFGVVTGPRNKPRAAFRLKAKLPGQERFRAHNRERYQYDIVLRDTFEHTAEELVKLLQKWWLTETGVTPAGPANSDEATQPG